MKGNIDISDTLIERPHGFKVAGRQFYIYPPTIGKHLLYQGLMQAMEVDMRVLMVTPSLEALRLAQGRREMCCRLVAYGTMRDKEEAFDESLLQSTSAYLSENLDEKELATLTLLVLTSDKTESIMRDLGIVKENERQAKIARCQDSKHHVSVGGLTIYGTLIDAACERYGWSYDYVVWGITQTNLRLMLADKISSMYLSDEELKKARRYLADGSQKVNAEGKKARETIKRYFTDG